MDNFAAYVPVSKSHIIPAKTNQMARQAAVYVLKLLSLVFVFSFPQTTSAQQTYQHEKPISAPVFLIASQDTFFNINEDSLIAASLSPVDTTIREGKSTTIATFASMLAPGTGQLYNESYWKAPIVWGLGYYFYSVYKNQDDLYKKYRFMYDTTITTSNPEGNTSIRGVRDFYKNQRNEFGWYLVITYVLNVLDAYVDAALYNFEVSPNLQGTNQWRVRMSFPLR